MKLHKFSLLMIVLGGTAFAQTQKFTMAEAVNGLRSNLAIKNISQFSWSTDGKSYINAVKNAYLITDIKTGKQDTLISLNQLNKGLADNKLKNIPQVKFADASKGYYISNGKMVWVEKSGSEWRIKKSADIPKKAENLKVFNDNQTFAFTDNNNLFVNKNGKKIAVSNESNENILFGASNVHRNEFGIDAGIFPAPNSESLAFYRMDQTMVADYPIIDWSVTPAVNANIKYPMAGKTS
ncbi:MAG: DPP IV N-terminal domain-containing protein, partial [Chryseobacterium sp.]